MAGGNILDVDGLSAQYDAQNQAYAKQAAVAAAQRKAQEQQAQAPPTLATVGSQDRGHVTPSIIDSVMNEVGQWGTAAQHVARDAMAGVATAAGNTMDAVKAGGSPADPNDPANLPTPVWDHAREAISDFRDAMVVQDPTGVDPVLQAGAQLALPFAAYSKALSALHGISNIVAAGAVTDVTALAPHDMRTADLIRLGQTTDTKIGAALRAIGPYGLNAYVNYLADRTNETEAQGRFKNALDGLGANLVLTPLLHAAGIVVKQGTAVARYAVQNGLRNTVSDLAPLGVRPPLQQAEPGALDPLDDLVTRQARADMERAAANPGAPRAPLKQGGVDVMEQEAQKQAKQDAEQAAIGNPDANPTITQLRSIVQSSNTVGHEAPVAQIVSTLGRSLGKDGVEGFYKQLFQRLSEQNLEGRIVPPGRGPHPEAEQGTRGYYSLRDDSISIHPPGLVSNQVFLHTLGHETVHMATLRAIKASPVAQQALQNVIEEARSSSLLTKILRKKQDAYGLDKTTGTPQEFVAEAEANPRLQQFLKTARGQDGRPLWDHYKEAIGGILGLSAAAVASPHFDEVLKAKEKTGA